MPRLEVTPKRPLDLFFLIDTSEGMNGIYKAELNLLLEDIYDFVIEFSKWNQDCACHIDWMTYGDIPHWYTEDGPEVIEDFQWDEIKPKGIANPGKAFELLNIRLKKYVDKNSYAPFIFMISASKTNVGYNQALAVLKENYVFQKSIKIGIPLGLNPNEEMLTQFTGTGETIIQNHDRFLIKRLLACRDVLCDIPVEEVISQNRNEPLPRLDVFFVVDTSEEMTGAKIDMLNKSLKELPISLCDITPNANMYFSVLKSGGSPEWVVIEASPGQMLIEWKDLEAGGSLKTNQALEMLLERLQVYSLNKLDDYMPVIILVNSNKAEEVDRNVLEQLQKVVWFKHALKIGFGVGDNPDMKMLAAITGNMEAVISTSDLDLFRRLYAPRKVGDYLEYIPDMEEIPGGKIQASRPSISKEIHLPSGKVFVDENLLAVNKCQIRACKLEEADDILFSLCYTTADDWDEHLYVTNSGKENLIVKHTIGKYGESIVLSGLEKECEYLIEPNENSTVHNRFSIGVSVQNNNLVIKNKSDDLVTVLETIIPGATVKMKKNSALLLADGTVCFELPIEDDDWW